jgi:hypothetical protein
MDFLSVGMDSMLAILGARAALDRGLTETKQKTQT